MKMNPSKLLVSTAAAIAVAGAVSFAYAQSNKESINVKYPNNLTQTQSDAALPCQPNPYNPHLPKDSKSRALVSGTTADCATVTVAPVAVETTVITPVVAQTDAALPSQPVPFTPSVQPVVDAPVANTSMISTELEPRADRN
jgi:hypothetical protein